MYTMTMTVSENVSGYGVLCHVWNEEQGEPRTLLAHQSRLVPYSALPDGLDDLEAIRECAMRALLASAYLFGAAR